jgi:putative endonuclease
MLENLNNRHYIGITTNTKRRTVEHNNGSTKSTRPFRPWKLIYIEKYKTRQEACKREWYLKHSKGYKEKINIIQRFGIK